MRKSIPNVLKENVKSLLWVDTWLKDASLDLHCHSVLFGFKTKELLTNHLRASRVCRVCGLPHDGLYQWGLVWVFFFKLQMLDVVNTWESKPEFGLWGWNGASFFSPFAARVYNPFHTFKVQCGSFLHLMLILTVPAQFIAVVYQTYDFIFHIWNSSWNKAAVYCMFLFNGWISDKDSSCTISCHIVQVLCPAPHNSLCCTICKGSCLLVSVFFTNREWRFILLFKSTFFHSRENN